MQSAPPPPPPPLPPGGPNRPRPPPLDNRPPPQRRPQGNYPPTPLARKIDDSTYAPRAPPSSSQQPQRSHHHHHPHHHGHGHPKNKHTVHGSSTFMEGDIRLIAEAQLSSFAPCGCICCYPCTSAAQRERSYVRIYDNRLETNTPCAPCCCCTDDLCVRDVIVVYPFDKPPNAPGICCVCIPCTCCGRPTIFNKVPRCLGCIDLVPCFGEQLLAAPSSCFGLRVFCCCGQPCYELCCSSALSPPLQHGGEQFLALYHGALQDFQQKHGRRDKYTARFTRVQDGFCNCDTAVEIPPSWPSHVMKMQR